MWESMRFTEDKNAFFSISKLPCGRDATEMVKNEIKLEMIRTLDTKD